MGKPIKSLQNNGERNARAFSLLRRMDLPYVSLFMRLRRQLTQSPSLNCGGLFIEEDGQFYCDQLLLEVNDLLRSDIPRLMKRTRGDISDLTDYIKKKLLLLGMRTAALPFGKERSKVQHYIVHSLLLNILKSYDSSVLDRKRSFDVGNSPSSSHGTCART